MSADGLGPTASPTRLSPISRIFIRHFGGCFSSLPARTQGCQPESFLSETPQNRADDARRGRIQRGAAGRIKQDRTTCSQPQDVPVDRFSQLDDLPNGLGDLESPGKTSSRTGDRAGCLPEYGPWWSSPESYCFSMRLSTHPRKAPLPRSSSLRPAHEPRRRAGPRSIRPRGPARRTHP